MTTAVAPRPLEGAAQPGPPRAHRPLLGLALAAVGVVVVLSPHVWAEAWELSEVSTEYLGFYLAAWAPFALLALLAGWRGLISPVVAVGIVPALSVVTALVQATPSTAAAAPVLLSGAVLIACGADAHLRRSPQGSTTVPLALAVALFVVLVVAGGRLTQVDSVAELSTFTVIFASIVVEALPFVLLGALMSALIEVFVSDRAFERVSRLPLRLQVPGLALCGMAMPVCECGSVPVARRLILRGVHPGAGVAFMLAAPILNPVVLFSTWVAYSGQNPAVMVASRAGLGLVLATATGLLIARMGAGKLLVRPDTVHHHHGNGRIRRVMDHLSADFFFMGKFIVAGAALAAALQTMVPQDVFTGVLTTPFVGASLLMVFSFLLSLCSEADAFVAISFVQFPIGAQLAFLVFGPVLDIKLSLLYAATFGWMFVGRVALIAIPIVLGGSMLVQAVAG